MKPEASKPVNLLEVLGFQPQQEKIISGISILAQTQLNFFGNNLENMSRITLPVDVDFSFITIREIMTELQRSLFDMLFSKKHRSTLEKLRVDPSKTNPVILCATQEAQDAKLRLDANDVLPIAGTVTLAPTSMSYPLCVALVQQHYFQVGFVLVSGQTSYHNFVRKLIQHIYHKH